MSNEGNVVHYGFIEAFIGELGKQYEIREIAVDRWNAAQVIQNLTDEGFTLVPFEQGFKDISPETKELMKLTLGKESRARRPRGFKMDGRQHIHSH